MSRKIWMSFVLLSLSKAQGNIVGSDAQNFNATTSGLDFVTVHSSETLEPGVLNFGIFLNYATNTLPYFENTAQGRTSFTDSLTGLDLNMGAGLMRNWDVGASLPQIIHQEVKSDSYRGQLTQTGNTEVRFNTKYRFTGDNSQGIAVVGSVNIDRIKNNPYSGRDAGPTYNLELAGDTTLSRVALAANLGHRWRNPGVKSGDYPIDPFRNQVIASLAASYLFSRSDMKIIFEAYGSFPTENVSADFNRSQTSAEALLGLKYDVNRNMALHFGGGTELINGTSSADWRVYTGLNYAMGPLFSKPTPSFKRTSPAAPVRSAAEPVFEIEVYTADEILFTFNSDHSVAASSKQALEEMAQHLKKPPGFVKLEVGGHTDSVGSEEFNLELSQRRAENVKKYLVMYHKFDPEKIEAVGYGETEPVADNGNFQGRQQNRRVEIKIHRPNR